VAKTRRNDSQRPIWRVRRRQGHDCQAGLKLNGFSRIIEVRTKQGDDRTIANDSQKPGSFGPSLDTDRRLALRRGPPLAQHHRQGRHCRPSECQERLGSGSAIARILQPPHEVRDGPLLLKRASAPIASRTPSRAKTYSNGSTARRSPVFPSCSPPDS
jgi:hypothetical protein